MLTPLPHHVLLDLCAALDVNPNEVSSITITATTVDVTLTTFVRRYPKEG